MTPFDAKATAEKIRLGRLWITEKYYNHINEINESFNWDTLTELIADSLSEAYQEGIRYGQTEMYWNDKRVGDLMAEVRAEALEEAAKVERRND